MPTLTGTLPTVNQRLTARIARSTTLGFAGGRGGGGGRVAAVVAGVAGRSAAAAARGAVGAAAGAVACGGTGRAVGIGGAACAGRTSAGTSAARLRSSATWASTASNRRLTRASVARATISSTGTASTASTNSTTNDSIVLHPRTGHRRHSPRHLIHAAAGNNKPRVAGPGVSRSATVRAQVALPARCLFLLPSGEEPALEVLLVGGGAKRRMRVRRREDLRRLERCYVPATVAISLRRTLTPAPLPEGEGTS